MINSAVLMIAYEGIKDSSKKVLTAIMYSKASEVCVV